MAELTRRGRKPTIKYVSVQFKGTYRQYTFKTILRLAPGDKVVVQTKQGLTTTEVFATHIPTPTNDMEYSWVLGKIDLEQYLKDFKLALEVNGINEHDK